MDQPRNPRDVEALKERFRQAAVTHRLLEHADQAITRAIAEPAGFAFVLLYGPTGVGKTKMLAVLADRINRAAPASKGFPLTPWLHQQSHTQVPLLLIEARPPDGSAFNRAYYYKSILTLLGERTYQQQVQIDIHAEQSASKRRPLRGKAAQFNDVPELREAAEEAMCRHGVRVILLDEAHHLLYTGAGGTTVTLQEQVGVAEIDGQHDERLAHPGGHLRFAEFWETQWADRAALPAGLLPPLPAATARGLSGVSGGPVGPAAQSPAALRGGNVRQLLLAVFLRVQHWLHRRVEGLAAARRLDRPGCRAADLHLGLDSGSCPAGGHLPANAAGCDPRGGEAESHGKQSRTRVAPLARGRTDCAGAPTASTWHATGPGASLNGGYDEPREHPIGGSATRASRRCRIRAERGSSRSTQANRGAAAKPGTGKRGPDGARSRASPSHIQTTAEEDRGNSGGERRNGGKAAARAFQTGDAEPIEAGKPASPTKPRRSRRVGEPKPRRYPVGEQETEPGT